MYFKYKTLKEKKQRGYLDTNKMKVGGIMSQREKAEP